MFSAKNCDTSSYFETGNRGGATPIIVTCTFDTNCNCVTPGLFKVVISNHMAKAVAGFYHKADAGFPLVR